MGFTEEAFEPLAEVLILCSWAAEIMFRVKYVPDQSKDPDSGQADP